MESPWKSMVEKFSEGFEHGQKTLDPSQPENEDYMEGHRKGLESLEVKPSGGKMGFQRFADDETEGTTEPDAAAEDEATASNDTHDSLVDWVGLMSPDEAEYYMGTEPTLNELGVTGDSESEAETMAKAAFMGVKFACSCGADCPKNCGCSDENCPHRKKASKTADQFLNDQPVSSDATPENYYGMTPPIWPGGEIPSGEQLQADAEGKQPDLDTGVDNPAMIMTDKPNAGMGEIPAEESVEKVAWRGRPYELVHIDKLAMVAHLFDFNTGQFLEAPDTEISKIAETHEDDEGHIEDQLKEPAHKPKVE